MNNRMAKWFALILSSIIIACSSPSVSYINQAASRGASITVVSPGGDQLGIQAKLESKFAQSGFDVVSESVAKSQVNIDKNTSFNNNAISSNTTINNFKIVNSAYIFKFQYSYRDDFPNGVVFSSFTGNVVDLRNGKLLATVEFKQGVFGGRSIDKTIELICNQLIEIHSKYSK